MTGAPIYDDPQEALEAALNGATAAQIAESVSARNIDAAWQHAESLPHTAGASAGRALDAASAVLGDSFTIRSKREAGAR